MRGNFLCGKLAVGKETPLTTMTKEQVIAALEARQKNAFCTIRISRPAKLRAAHKHLDLRRVSEIQFQSKGEYGNKKIVRDAIEAGIRDEPKLPLYVASVEKVKQIKFWHHTNGNVSLPQPQGGNGTLWARWELDGQPVSDESVDTLLTAEDTIAGRARKSEALRAAAALGQAPHNTINLENIVEIR